MEKTYIPSLLMTGLALIVSACVTAPYVAPQNGAVADLAIRIKPAQGTGFNLYIYDNAESCSGAKTVIDDAGKVSISATKLVADKLTTFGYSEVMGNTSCNINFSFFPNADHIYVLDTVTGRHRCSVRIVDATDIKKMFAVPMINRTVNGAMCAPLKKIDQPPK
ncbi:MAG: hypothetical protein HY254_15475 [Burkholderiales bacterium]|nr:hypothetical protein [Burkholderiales bacterium]